MQSVQCACIRPANTRCPTQGATHHHLLERRAVHVAPVRKELGQQLLLCVCVCQCACGVCLCV